MYNLDGNSCENFFDQLRPKHNYTPILRMLISHAQAQ